ncbi:MAG TPA: 3-dehydroquinate synthase [Bacteroidia bacterium]|nr:3-dehydroquinate synthase [Bacteroidia bacterium]HNS12318.1 3-dehydroquinate synthase [Bacteroidia bacterium]
MEIHKHYLGSEIHVGHNCLNILNDFLSGSNQIALKFILVDTNTKQICLPVFLKELSSLQRFEIIEIQAGDESKNIENCIKVWEKLTRANVDKDSILISLGGGMVGDLGGFVASTILRGIKHIQVPTTLLSMVDSSSGGKTGINFLGLKNQIGSFYHPKAVYVFPEFLNTLSDRELNSGMAEIAKHGLIADKFLWNSLSSQTSSESANLAQLIERSIEIKNSFVVRDEKDQGVRHALNFGHTIGHAIEAYSLANHKDPLRHGEAIAYGIVAEALLSKSVLGLGESELDEIILYFTRHFDFANTKFNVESLLDYAYKDKKNINGKLNFTLIPQIGLVTINQFADVEKVRNVMEQTMQLFNSSVL